MPIKSMTVNAIKQDIEKFLKAGMDDYFVKSHNPELMFNNISK